jgi:NAD(P)-dependent dehydrogenase (short-subunit alcohol dehydrogenase family)
MFQKGNLSNARPIGDERIDIDGYTYIKVKQPNKWVLKHRWLYEKEKGKIPKGYNLILVARDEQKLKELAEELSKEDKIETQVISMDLSIEQNCIDLHKSVKDVDILINNAGVSLFSDLTETSVEDFDQILSINLRPVFITSRLLAIHRKAQDSPQHYGRIINICSTRHLMSEPESEGYAASKGGIYSLTHALALSLAKQHITVNSISPGWIQTQEYELLRPEDHTQHPSGRVGKPEDIARMCLFLCQEENDFINGENITIDGGMTKKMIYIE